MARKLIGIAVVMVLLSSVLGLVACGDNTEEDEMAGTLFTLQKAYDDGLLTQADLKSIAYYQNGGGDDESFVPQPKSPVALSAETESAIKESAATSYRAQTNDNGESMYPNAVASDFTISKYYGTYNGSVVVMIDGCVDYQQAEKTEIVGGVTFFYGSSQGILIWKQN